MNILILGGGGREHALCWKIAQSPLAKQLYVAPGNAGTSEIATNVALNPTDFVQIGRFCREKDIDLMVIGPEDPLVEGIVDYFLKNENLKNTQVLGPDKIASQLEGSKEFSKKFMMDNGIPTAAYQSFTAAEISAGKAFLKTLKPPYVLKADGLAAGKGVVILQDLPAAEKELEEMLMGKFGEASSKVVIEEFLDGIEFSVFALTDGRNYRLLPVAKDYKRIGEGDTGLNTGGMGAVSPPSFVTEELMEKVKVQIIEPTIRGLSQRKMRYRGFIFFGLIKVQGEPKVIEYNVRMGDPETEVVMPRIASDILPMLKAAAEGDLGNTGLEIDKKYAVTVMAVSEGYPQSYEKGKKISGLENVMESIIFHAGTRLQNNEVYSNGGRVMAFTSFGDNMKEALKKTYSSLNKVCFEGISFRKDIGYDL